MYIEPKIVIIDQDKFNSSVYIADYCGYEINWILENANLYLNDFLQQIKTRHTYIPDEEERAGEFTVFAMSKKGSVRFSNVCLIKSCKGNLYLFNKDFLKPKDNSCVKTITSWFD